MILSFFLLGDIKKEDFLPFPGDDINRLLRAGDSGILVSGFVLFSRADRNEIARSWWLL